MESQVAGYSAFHFHSFLRLWCTLDPLVHSTICFRNTEDSFHLFIYLSIFAKEAVKGPEKKYQLATRYSYKENIEGRSKREVHLGRRGVCIYPRLSLQLTSILSPAHLSLQYSVTPFPLAPNVFKTSSHPVSSLWFTPLYLNTLFPLTLFSCVTLVRSIYLSTRAFLTAYTLFC